MNIEDKIKHQQKLIQAGNPKIDITRACRIDDGIQRFAEDEINSILKKFDTYKNEYQFCFFTPASGSGSRMFSFLHDFLNANDNEKAKELTQHFLNRLTQFAFFNKLPTTLKDNIESGDFNFEELIDYLLNENGLSFSTLPKGLIPFHSYGAFMVTPIQEHLIQGATIGGRNTNFHFTINEDFKAAIKENKENLEAFTGIPYKLDYSIQAAETNSVAFDEELKPLKIADELITRPSGHGALIHNLNEIDADFIFIKNIDNVQHADKSSHSLISRKLLCAKLIEFRNLSHEILRNIDNGGNVDEDVLELNTQFDLKLNSSQLEDPQFLKSFLNRPLRVCGMVVNEGQPGGGPFWVKNDNGIEQRQIIERAQLSMQPEQMKLVVRSTHFNPNEIVCSVRNYKNEKFDLVKFSDPDQYFVVNKTYHGQNITFIEKPGLWNGGMANWLTLFYEIEKECFSPVKTVLDLLKPPHRES